MDAHFCPAEKLAEVAIRGWGVSLSVFFVVSTVQSAKKTARNLRFSENLKFFKFFSVCRHLLSIFFVKKPRPDGKTGVRRREYRFHVGVESAQHSPHTAVMGKVIVRIKLTNLFDLAVQKRGASKARPRQTEVEALVDTGATRLYLKPSVIKRLGLQRVDTVRSQTTNGEAMRYKYEPAQLELMGRKEMFDVMEARHAAPNRLGKAPLALLDFLLDRKRRKLISNPAHGGEQMTEEY